MSVFAAVLGWVGTIGTFVTYVMVSRGRMVVTSVRYASLNAVGGILAGTASALYGAWPSAAANFAWAVVAIHTLTLCLHRRVRKSKIHMRSVLKKDHSPVDDDQSPIVYVMQTPISASIANSDAGVREKSMRS